MTSIAQIIRRRRHRRQQKRAQQVRSQNLLWSLLGLAVLGGVTPVVVVFGGAMNAYVRAVQMVPQPRQSVEVGPLVGASTFYDGSGTTLLITVEDPQGEERTWIPLSEIPQTLIRATLVVEDPDYLTVPRLNLLSAAQLLWDNTVNGSTVTDPSLTGRLIRNAIAAPPEFPTRDSRALEIALAAEINRRYSPEEVLEWHLNTNFYGNQAYGIDSAAQIYLGKSARDLTLDEAALLASIPTAPQYNPVDNPEAARSRQRDVLQRLLANGAITQRQFEEATSTPTTVRADAGQTPLVAPEFTRYARQQAEAILDALGRDGAALVSRGGLRITTTLDLDLYYQMDCLLRAHLERLSGRDAATVRADDGQPCISAQFLPAVELVLPTEDTLPPDAGTMVVLDVATGEIRALVGAAMEPRYQPGPTLHPFVYLDAFTNLGNSNSTQLYTPARMVLDIPRQFPGTQDGLLYIPNNADGRFLGPLNLRDAMAAGRLPPVVQIANERGLNRAIRNTANPMGINTLTEGNYSLSLLEGGGAVSALDVTFAYSVFASQGFITGRVIDQTNPTLRQHDPVAVRRIEDANGAVLWEYGADEAASNRIPILERQLPYIVNDILSDTTTRLRVSGRSTQFSRRAAVVEGMTGDRTENWTVGYTPQIVTTVHLTRGDSRALALSPTAPEGAAAVWQAAMEYAHIRDNLPVQDWTRPDGIIEQVVCDLSGLLPTDACAEHRRTEIFPDGFQPRTADTYWQIIEVNSQNPRLRATATTDPALRRSEVFFVPPPEALDWWRANNRPLPPEAYDTASLPEQFETTSIDSPTNYAYVGGQLEIRGSLNPDNLQYYQLAYGATLSPREWIDITPQQTTFDPTQPLGVWDTAGLDGLYSLRLTAVQNDNTVQNDIIYVTVDNIPPSVVFVSPTPAQVFRWPNDGEIVVQVLVQDDYKVNRVVFFHYGEEIGVRDDCHLVPDDCSFRWPLTRTGLEVFQAQVFDEVGNSVTADITVEVIRGN
ncbi:MAG: transglycosylase domain-containing protein [bacterium]|nr:transglycosylase domain-containing protein [bacterium]